MATTLSGWGRYPVIEAERRLTRSRGDVAAALSSGFTGIAHGLGRSYGDTALADQVLDTTPMDRLLELDAQGGRLRCQAGASFDDILGVIVPRGWFLPVTPGTKFVTVGGAIAGDVHGKNHHREGCFGDHVDRLSLMTADGTVVECSPTANAELFDATCGGIGLTGAILDATIRLKPIRSAMIDETTHRATSLDATLKLFDRTSDATYSVAWIDCLATGDALGRSLVMTGEHAPEGPLTPHTAPRLSVPIDAPNALLNPLSVRVFNALYYRRMLGDTRSRRVHYGGFFYPLDGVAGWNRLYGKGGFTQYQFVIDRDAGRDGLRTILRRIAESRRGSFLAVLKEFGPASRRPLSFPKAGYTLALDFKIDDELFGLLDELDAIVLDHGGRLYLAKDARMSEQTFKCSYPRWDEFVDVCRRHDPRGVFRSRQSDRLGLTG
ncbi:MAG: FAD-binding oxidoreductase [Planctomycetota bacterium]